MNNYIERPRYFCSLGGALSTLEALPDTITILHAAIGCAASIAWGQNGGSALQVGGYCGGLTVPSSNVTERDIVFGGIDRLDEEIRNTLAIMDGGLYVVITGCVTELIGDDIASAVRQYQKEGVQIISAATGGFKGNSYDGYDIVMSALARQFVQKGLKKKKQKVNVFGVVPYMDCFWRGNLEGIRKLLEALGLEVNTFFTADDTLESLGTSSEAALNIVVSDLYGIAAAEIYKQEHGIPYIVSSFPIGPTASAELLRKVVEALSLPVDVDALIEEKTRRYYRYLGPLTDCYADADLQKYAVIIADVNYAVGVTRFLSEDLGWIPELVQFTDILEPGQQQRIGDKLKNSQWGIEPLVVFDTNASEAINYIGQRYPRVEEDFYAKSLSPAFVVGSSFERELASKLGAPHLSVSFPVSNRAILNRGYAGFSGGLTLTEDLLGAAVLGR